MYQKAFLLFTFLLLLTIPYAVFAQDDNDSCPVLVESALAAVGDMCGGLGRNQVCYGNAEVTAMDWNNAALANFASPGDMSGISEMASLVTMPLDVAQDTWGIAMLALQVDLPETLPGQNVIFLIYGDVQLHSEVAPSDQTSAPPTCAVTATGGINLRGGPGTGYAVVGGLGAGDTATADGRSAAGDWLHLAGDVPLWAYAPLLTTECDLTTLAVLEAGAAPESWYNAPMQAFRFTARVGEPHCAEVPRDGLLVQAPTDTTVHFLINGIDVEIGSTALLLPVSEALSVNTLAGIVRVSAAGETRDVEPGFRTVVMTDVVPSEPEPYAYNDVRTAPTYLLPEPVDIPFAVPGTPHNWTDSGVVVKTGQTFTITASGNVDGWPQCRDICPTIDLIDNCAEVCPNTVVGPGGGWMVVADLVPNSGFPMPGALFWTLLGRIGDNGTPFVVGEGGTFTADSDGTLQFIVNDGISYPEDTNTGAFLVVIKINEGE